MVFVTGCALFGGKEIESKWGVLKTSDVLSCDAWSKRKNDIAQNAILAVYNEDAEVTGFMVESLNRRGIQDSYYAPFENSTSFDRDDFKDIEVGGTSLVIGGAYKNSPLAAVFIDSSKNSRIEFRDVNSNVVKYSAKISGTDFSGGRVIVGKNNTWLALKNDDKMQISTIQFKPKFKLKKLNKNFPSAELIGFANNKELIAIRQTNSKKLVARKISANSFGQQEVDLQVPVNDQIENWSAAEYNGGVVVVYVDGDSLVGQATLKVSLIRWNAQNDPSVTWTKEFSVNDVHVTRPTIIKYKDKLKILMTTWMDAEATIARYSIDGASLKFDGYQGVLKQGAQIESLFQGVGSNDLYAIVREKAVAQWNYKVCEL